MILDRYSDISKLLWVCNKNGKCCIRRSNQKAQLEKNQAESVCQAIRVSNDDKIKKI